MLTKKTLIVIVLIAVITVGILIPVLILTSQPPKDNTPPTIQILSPINTVYLTQEFVINITTSDTDVDSIWYRIYNDTAGSWVDATNITWTTPIQRTLSDGGYTLYAWANDTAGNIANPVNISFSIDGPPMILIVSPVNTAYFSQTTQINISLASPDSNIDAIWYRIYNITNHTWVDSNIVIYTGSCQRALSNGGIYTLYAWANDTRGRIAPMQSVIFTMYQEIIYSGDHAFSSNFTVETYQKVIFQNGAFSFSPGYILLSGILAMYNVTWTSNLYIYANSEVMGTNVTFNERVYTFGNLVASLDNITCGSAVELWDNSSMTLTDVVFLSLYLTLYDSANLTVHRASNFGFDSYGRSIADVSDSALVGLDMYEESNVTLRDCGSVPYSILANNASLTLVNTSVTTLYQYISFETGSWIMDHEVISGTGTYWYPTLTRIDAPVAGLYVDIRVHSSTNLVMKNASFSEPLKVYLYTFDSSNLTLENTNIGHLVAYDASNVTLRHSAILSTLDLYTNGTVYLENTYGGTILHGFSFLAGTIAGYNTTFTGASSWTFPKVTLGPNVTYYNYLYYYETQSNVSFTLTNTSKIQYLYARDSSNITLVFCNSPIVQIHTYNDANMTLYYSNLNTVIGYNEANITVYNSTCNSLYLHQTAFGNIINHSHIITLNVYDSATYYCSPDSKIGP